MKIETGRWSRTPRESRLCSCGAVQDERHVVQDCALLNDIRDRYSDPIIFPDIVLNAYSEVTFKLNHDILMTSEAR